MCRLLADLMLQKKLYLATAESCTGGMIAAACTDLSGSSQWFERGFVTYSNRAKTQMLGVDVGLITEYGAVSEQVAEAMAAGAIVHSAADLNCCNGMRGRLAVMKKNPSGLCGLAGA